MSIELKVKALALTAEAKIIRRQELRLKKRARKLSSLGKPNDATFATLGKLAHHRREVVRRQARRTHLARGFLSGRPYPAIENYTRRKLTEHDWKEIERMVVQYRHDNKGDIRDLMQQFSEWKDSAESLFAFNKMLPDILNVLSELDVPESEL